MSFIEKARLCNPNDYKTAVNTIKEHCIHGKEVIEESIANEPSKHTEHFNWCKGRFSAYEDLLMLISYIEKDILPAE